MQPLRTALKGVLRLLPFIPAEGSSTASQLRFFDELLKERPSIRSIMEIGFNTGVSSRAFLRARPDTTVVSFDLGEHTTVQRGKDRIDREFPGRHELVLGDSRQTVRRYRQRYPTRKFDLIFIDGGHDYDVAKADLLNAESLAHAETVVIMDDLTPWWDWGVGPTRAWQEGVDAGAVMQLGIYKDGRPVSTIEGRGWIRAWGLGQYTFVSRASAASGVPADS